MLRHELCELNELYDLYEFYELRCELCKLYAYFDESLKIIWVTLKIIILFTIYKDEFETSKI